MKATTGVYFRREDYASFWVRLLVDVIDFLVFGFVCAVLTIAELLALPPGRTMLNTVALTCAAVAFSYFVVLKRSSFRTFGYRVGRVRIVGLDGQAPSYSALILRLIFGMLGPVNWVIDLIWLSNDTNRQALRDKFASTYVVRANARAAGEGRIVFRQYDIASYNCLFREVEVERSVNA